MDRYKKYIDLIDKYNGDERLLLRNNPSLEILRTFSPQRQGLIEWIPLDKIKSALFLGADSGTPIEVLLKKEIEVCVLCEDKEIAEYLLHRYKKYAGKLSIAFDKKELEGKRYDSAWLISCDRKYTEGDIAFAREKVAEGGRLVYAAANRYGMKYLAGAELPINNNSLKRAKEYMPNADVYYLMPDIYFPTSIYTGEHLPSIEDMKSYIPAYDDTEYAGIDLSDKLSDSIKDGCFDEYAGGYVFVL